MVFVADFLGMHLRRLRPDDEPRNLWLVNVSKPYSYLANNMDNLTKYGKRHRRGLPVS